MTRTPPTAVPDVQKWGLLIGINEYPRLSEQYNLQGCVNDINAIEELLISSRFAFPSPNILKLTSPASDPSFLPTRENILKAFQCHLIENNRMQAGDIVVIYYSGHGSQIPDEDGDEEDGYDETIVPCDGGSDRSKREDVLDISDDEISLMLDRLAKRTQNINLIFDSCHSGTITRAMDAERKDAQGRERYLPPATYTIPPVRIRRACPKGPSDWMPLSEGYVLISACMAHERAREDGFGFWRRERHGILTYYILEAMSKVDPDTTYLDIWDEVRIKVAKRNRWQNPQIEGAYERKVFGGAASPRMRYVEVKRIEGQEVVLAVGLTNGATLNSRFAIYPKGVERFEDQAKRLTTVKLVRVEAFNSFAVIEKGSLLGVEQGAPAIEIEHHYGDMRMIVDVVGDDPVLDEIRKQIGTSNLLHLATTDDVPVARVRLRYPFDADGKQITSKGEKLFILSAGDGHALVEPISLNQNGFGIVKEKLEHIARYHNILAIHNPDPLSKLKDKIELRLLNDSGKRKKKADLPPVARNDGGDLVLTVGEKIVIEAENHSNQPLYLIILDCDSSWGVTPIFPEAGARDSAVQAMSKRRLKRRSVNLYEHEIQRKNTQPLPRQIIKAIATTERIGFRSLWQQSTRFDEKKTSLERLVESALGKTNEPATRSLEQGSDLPVKDWTTAELVFHITV